MSNALIGYTGFVGSNLMKQNKFDELFNSTNIEEIRGKEFDLVVCAGAPAEKWKANSNPQNDRENIQSLINCLQHVKAKEFILISTIDVYKHPLDVNEITSIDEEGLSAYGLNRHELEKFIQKSFLNHSIIRLPALFGSGLKKNFIFDLLNNNCLDLTHKDSEFQFYNLDYLWLDIERVRENNLKLVNFTTQSISASDIVKECFNSTFNNITKNRPVKYNVKSIYSNYFADLNDYFYSRDQIISQIKDFVNRERNN